MNELLPPSAPERPPEEAPAPSGNSAPPSSAVKALPPRPPAPSPGTVASSPKSPTCPSVPAPPSLRLPAVFGDYELLEEIARGGMGVVYKAREISLDRVVALKMILEGQLGTEESVQRFHREARAAGALDHPNIVPVYHSGLQDGRHFFTMAYVEGANLKEVVKRDGLPSPQRTVALLLTVADAVAFAHRHGILHRDLKPENVLIDRDGRPRVTDFGLAKRLVGDPGLTASGQILGTPCYLPPEQATGDLAQLGPTADVYGLGSILYFLLTGRPPFQGRSSTAVLAQVITQPPLPPRQLNPEAPEGLEAICLKCLEKDPAHRYDSATALAAALREWAAHADRQGAPAPEPSPAEAARFATLAPSARPTALPPPAVSADRPRPRPRRRWAVPFAAGLLLLATAGYVGYVWWRLGSGPESPPGPVPPSVAVIPQTLRADFGLEVEMLGGEQGQDGVIRLREGEAVKFRIKTERDAYVGVWTVEADGTVVQLFPNDHDRQHLFRAGEVRIVPEAAVAEAVLSAGLDRVWVQAATEPWQPAEGQRMGPFVLFKTEREQQAAVERVRGIRLRPEVRLADRVLEYRVGPR